MRIPAIKSIILAPAFVLVALTLMASGCDSSSSSSSTPSPAASSSAVANGSGAPAAAAPKVLLDQAGSGTASTAKFSTGSDWDLAWSYDCTKFAGGSGNFIAEVTNSDGSTNFDNQGVNQLGAKGQGTEHYHSGGTFFLKMSSECSWHVSVTG